MKIIRSVSEMQQWSTEIKNQRNSIGFVPTMGALHQGHAELFKKSVLDQDKTVVSIFVNALQFNSAFDLEAYPRQLEDDIILANEMSVDVLFVPSPEEMYPPNFSSTISAGDIATQMEGLHRPGHFDGVATVVVKLLHAVSPDIAYFGVKDFQQVAVIQHVVRDLNIRCEIEGVPTVRDENGLALSSRNARLTPEHLVEARQIFRLLRELAEQCRTEHIIPEYIKSSFTSRLQSNSSAKVEYVEVVDSATLHPSLTATAGTTICVAVWFGDVRLIDNISIDSPTS